MNDRIMLFLVEPGFVKLFHLFKEKYRSIGRVGGNVSLEGFTDREVEAIAGFLGQPKGKLLQKGSIALKDFENELPNTGFSGLNLKQLLEEVLRETIFTKKEEKEMEQREEATFIESLKMALPQGAWWFDWIHSRSTDARWIWSLFRQDKEELFEKCCTVLQAFQSLPGMGEFERLPFFAQRTTGNPHYFDGNETAGKLILHCMYVDQVLHGNDEAAMPKTVEELNDLLAEYGIFRDDLWNFVTCQGLLASAGNNIHPVWQAAIETNTVMNVPMKELVKLERVWPARGKKVWIVENSSVSSTIMDAIPTAPIICTHGQIRMAGWKLLDLLVEAGCTLYYSGDIDPEGLVIAEKLKRRYQDKAVMWRMDRSTYEASLSNEDISSRLKKLDYLKTAEWGELVQLMREIRKAGYQEAIVSWLISDIEESGKGI